MTELPTRSDIEALQAKMARMPQVELETRHHFGGGLYIRELPRAAGTTIVGKVHQHEHFYLVLKGIVTVVGDGKRETYEAPAIILSPPGSKRAVFAHSDAICATVHRVPFGSTEADLPALEADLIEPDDTALFDAHNRLKQSILEVDS